MLIYKTYKQKKKKILMKIKVYLIMFIFMIQKLTQIKMINFRFMLADMAIFNNLIET